MNRASSLQPVQIDLVSETFRREASLLVDSVDTALHEWISGDLDAAPNALALVGWLIDSANGVRQRRVSTLGQAVFDVLAMLDMYDRGQLPPHSVPEPRGSLMTLAYSGLVGLRRVINGGRCHPDLVDRLRDASVLHLHDDFFEDLAGMEARVPELIVH